MWFSKAAIKREHVQLRHELLQAGPQCILGYAAAVKIREIKAAFEEVFDVRQPCRAERDVIGLRLHQTEGCSILNRDTLMSV